jgi:pimeloyl-ACP methyl ester carboxylesterase
MPAFNEREFLSRVEAADPAEFARIIINADPQETNALKVHLGEAAFERQRKLALESNLTRALAPRQGNIVVLHGIMGGELTLHGGLLSEQIWLNALRILFGRFEALRLDDKGASINRVDATGILKRYYGEMLLYLAQRWNVQAFWYDWRLSVHTSADQLAQKILDWFGPGATVHLVAHSMGGLVARDYFLRHNTHWTKGSRLIMLGTPNHGSFAIAQLLAGFNDSLSKLAMLDLLHKLEDLTAIVQTFIGPYQMLPSPLQLDGIQKLYTADTYQGAQPAQPRLDAALEFHRAMRAAVDPDTMMYIAGDTRATYDSIKDFTRLAAGESYGATFRGDGTVPHSLGLLRTEDGRDVPTWYLNEEHGALPANQRVLKAVEDLILTGQCELDRAPQQSRALDTAVEGVARATLQSRRAVEEAQLAAHAAIVRARTSKLEEAVYVDPLERALEDNIISGLLGSGPQLAPQTRSLGASPLEAAQATPKVAAPTCRIRVRVVQDDIQNIGTPAQKADLTGELPIDALAVGHYIGIKPTAAELALDKAISGAYSKNGKVDLLLTQFTERGILRGDLGEPFYLSDPREQIISSAGGRLVCIAGMGMPGSFAVPELTVVARELCWSLGKLAKKHLACVLIGAGNGNLSEREAIHGWFRGIRQAIAESAEAPDRMLQTITFVERDAKRVENIQAALALEKEQLAAEFIIESPDAHRDTVIKESEKESDSVTSLTVELNGSTYRFGAITRTASVPQREVTIDPTLVMQANDELVAAGVEMHGRLGEFLQRILIPRELRQYLTTDAPLVLSCDTTVARIHWEMMAQPEDINTPNEDRIAGKDPTFLGIYRGFTRQLRTTFAPPPEPPPPPSRVLRILIVGDPAADRSLPGAKAEAYAVQKLFQTFRALKDRRKCQDVEVVSLIGPGMATRTSVLRTLMEHPPFDLLHYAGHCYYDDAVPADSGWIFTGGTRITANELNRIDRVPRFVFSNACQSGITPDRSDLRAAGMAPSFAETFFARGVSNFVCTAWPVDDQAARTFAEELYQRLLGMEGQPAVSVSAKSMHVAMREARRAIQFTSNGARTWGAYQHYGNPNFRLFGRSSTQREDT